MAARGEKTAECCANGMNLPEEMEAALRRQGGLEGLSRRVPDRERLAPRSNQYKALADPIRLQILYALSTIELCPCILKELTALSDSKLSYHLNILEGAGMITSSPRKRWRIYMLTAQGKELMQRHGLIDAEE